MQRGIPNKKRDIQKCPLSDHIVLFLFIFQVWSLKSSISITWEFAGNVNSWSPTPDVLNQKPRRLGDSVALHLLITTLGVMLSASYSQPQSPWPASTFPESDIIRACWQRETAAKKLFVELLFLTSRNFSRTKLVLRSILLAYTSKQRTDGVGLITPYSMASMWISHIFLRILVHLEKPDLRFSGFVLE